MNLNIIRIYWSETTITIVLDEYQLTMMSHVYFQVTDI